MRASINCNQEMIQNAAVALLEGNLVAFPTETVYGLGADAADEKAISRIYQVKGRPHGHPIIVHVSSIVNLSKWAVEVPDYAFTLAKKFWPGPMTLILKRSELAKDYITGGQNFIGIRVPNQPIALALLKKFELLGGHGIAAPSANKFGAVSPTTAEAVYEEVGSSLSSKDLILDGGNCVLGVESTIINCTQQYPEIVRPGWLTIEQIAETTNLKPRLRNLKDSLKVPGQLESHYSPKAKVTLDVIPGSGEGFIAMADIPTPEGAIRLAAPETIEQYAAQLYSALRAGDQMKISQIMVIQPLGGGLALAIRDRLGKAANA